MGSQPVFEAAADRLLAARASGRPGLRLPESCRPRNLDEALEIQRLVRSGLADRIGGWKSSVPGPPVVTAPIYASTIQTRSPCIVLPRNGMALVEPEIGFVVARDVPPHFPDNDVVDCIGEVRLVLELIESRYSDPGMASFPELVADNLSNQGLFVGPVVSTLPSDLPGSFLLQVSTSQGVILERECRHPDGHPLRTLRSLMQSLAETGETLLQGQVLITGSFAGVLQFQAGEPICIRFGNLGELCVEFHEAAYPGICNLST